MTTISAVFEKGVFRPLDPVNLPDGVQVEFEPRTVDKSHEIPSLDDVYSLLGERFSSGDHDVAARHNEHQP